MPSATLVRGPEKLGPRQFHAPKQSDLRGWWNAVRRASPGWELGYYASQRADVTSGSIVFHLGPSDVLVIDRTARSMG
jgi:hypothetical protein